MATKRTSSSRRGPGVRRPAGYDAAAYPSFAVTVDIVVLTIIDGRLHVLLVKRRDEPFADTWALPGGFKQPDETLDEAAARELAEETSVSVPRHLTQFGAYGDPGRDPRTNVVTVAYLAPTHAIGEIAAGSDAADAGVRPVAEALDGVIPLAFDHVDILRDAVAVTERDIGLTDLSLSFLPTEFTLTDLQGVYEAAWHIELDPANFRRALNADPTLDYVTPTGRRAPSSARGGRPPQLFRGGTAWIHGPPIHRP